MTERPAASADTPPSFVWPATMPRDAVPVVLTVLRERAGMRLDAFLVCAMPRLSRSRAAQIARSYAFATDGTALKPAKLVRAGETVVLFRPAWEEPDAPRDVPVLYEDDTLLALHKPAGLAVHPTARVHRNTLTSILAERYPRERIALCHRLDKETSGVLVAARTLEAEVAMKNAFAARAVKKTYHAIVHGSVRDDAQLVDAPLALAGGEVAVAMRVCPASEGGLEARTRVRVLERLAGFTLVECAPETGRQHQLRVHLAHLGHPIVGDKLYAHGPEVFVAAQREGMTDALRAVLLLDRHALHAYALRCAHPRTGASLELVAPLPSDLAAFVEAHRAGDFSR